MATRGVGTVGALLAAPTSGVTPALAGRSKQRSLRPYPNADGYQFQLDKSGLILYYITGAWRLERLRLRQAA